MQNIRDLWHITIKCQNVLRTFWRPKSYIQLLVVDRLQRVQNCLERVVCKASRFSGSRRRLRSLHWLPIKYCISFKLSTITFRQLKYLFDVLQYRDRLFLYYLYHRPGGGPRAVVSTAASNARVTGSVPGLGGLKETKTVASPSTCESQYCGEPPWPRSSVFDLRPPGREFRILCLEDSVISIISPSSGGSPCPV